MFVMKNLFKFIAPMAVAAIALVACQKEANNGQDVITDAITIRVHATAQDFANIDTKTYIDTYQGTANTVLWGTGEYMNLCVTSTSGETTENKWATSTDESADLFEGEPSALFEFSVSPQPASTYKYQGLYPASAASTSSNTNPASYKVNLPATQNATATSYDPAAYIMVAKPEDFGSVETDWTASFRRATALNKITLKNVPSGVSISSVKITATGKKLAGGRHFDLTAGEGTDVYGTDATIEVKYATALSGTNVDVWFTSWDVEIQEGEKLTIVAYTTDSKSYTKEITVPAGKTIKFQEGYLNTLGANLSGINPEDVAAFADGDYLVLAKHNNSYYAMKGEANGTRIAYEDYSGSLVSYNGEASLVWTINASGSSYTFKNGGNYLGWTSGNAADLVAEADYDADKCLMSIGDNGDGTYKVTNTNTPTRYLAKNSSNAWFAFYESAGQYGDIVFVPATALETVATPTFNPAAGAVASGTEVSISCATSDATIHYTVDGTDPTSSSATYSSPIEITATTTIKAIAVKDGMADSEVATATYTVQGAGTDWELVSDFSTIADGGEYIFVNVQNSTSYYMNTATCNQGGGTGCVALTTLPTESGFVASDNMILVLSGSAEGFVASNKEGKQLKIGATNNGLAINADSGTSLTFYTDGDVSGYTLKGQDTNDATRYIGMNSTTNFRCYNSVNANVKTGEYVWYHHIGTGSNVTWNLESIAITTAPSKTTYIAGETFNPAGMVVTGHFVDADDATNTKDEAVTGFTFSPDGALAVSDTQVTITYQGKTATQNITVEAAPVTTIADALGAPGTYEVPDVAVYAVKGNALILGDASGKIYAYKSNHGLSVGDVRTVSGSTIWFNSGDVYEFDAPTFSGSGTTTINHGTAIEFADNAATLQTETGFVSTGSGAAHPAVYVHAIGNQSGRNITTSNGKVLYLSATETETDGKTVEVYGYVYAYSASHTNFNFLVTSIEEYVDPNAKVITALKSSITGISADGVTNATETAVYSLTNASDSDVTVTPDGTVVTSASVSGGALTYSVAANSGAARSGSVTLAVTGGNSVEITISQDKASGSTTPYYVKVTDLSTLSAGDKVIIVNQSKVALPAFTSTGTLSATDISAAYDSTNDQYSVTTAVSGCAITLVAPTTAISNKVVFKLKQSNNYFIVKTKTSGTGFDPNTTSTAVSGDWTLSMDSNGRVNILNNLSGSTRCILWRSGTTNKFGAYASSNINDTEYYNINLYKLTN